MKYNDNGTPTDIKVKAFDTLPVGTEVDYDGSTVPFGWEEVENEVVLYETALTTSTGFYTGTQVISEDIKNFKYIDVWVKQKGSNARCMIFKYFVCDNQIYRGNIFIPAIGGAPPTGISGRVATLEIIGTTATLNDNYSFSMTPTNITTTADGVAIVKIVGYK